MAFAAYMTPTGSVAVYADDRWIGSASLITGNAVVTGKVPPGRKDQLGEGEPRRAANRSGTRRDDLPAIDGAHASAGGLSAAGGSFAARPCAAPPRFTQRVF